MVLKSLLLLLSCALVSSHPFDFGEILKGIQGAESGKSNNPETFIDINKVLENAQGHGSGDGSFAENSFDSTKLLESIQKIEEGDSDFTDILEDISSFTNGFASNVLPDSSINAIQKASEELEAANLLTDLPDKNILNIPDDKLVEFDDSHTTVIANRLKDNNFDILDTNEDGLITEEDGIHKDIFAILLEGDLNRDDKINMKEYVTRIHNFKPDKYLVKIMDENEDGYLTGTELVLTPYIRNILVWDYVLDQMDTSDDGQLSIQEYIDFLHPADPEEEGFVNRVSSDNWEEFVGKSLLNLPTTCEDMNGVRKYCKKDTSCRKFPCSTKAWKSAAKEYCFMGCGLKEYKIDNTIKIIDDEDSKVSLFSEDQDTDITIEMRSFIPKLSGKSKSLYKFGIPQLSPNPMNWVGLEKVLKDKLWVRAPARWKFGTLWIATDEKEVPEDDGEDVTLSTTIKVSTANFGNRETLLNEFINIERKPTKTTAWRTSYKNKAWNKLAGVEDWFPTLDSLLDGPKTKFNENNPDHTYHTISHTDKCSATFSVSSAKDFPFYPISIPSLRPYVQHKAEIRIQQHSVGYSIQVETSHSEEFAFELKINGKAYGDASSNINADLKQKNYKLFDKRHKCLLKYGELLNYGEFASDCQKQINFETSILNFREGRKFECGQGL